MSTVELKQHVRGHITFSKWDIIWNLGGTTLEVVSWDTVIPQGDPITLPTTADVGDKKSSSMEAQGAYNTTPSSFGYPPKEETPPAEPIASPTDVDVKHTPLGPVETLLGRDATVLLAKSDVEIQKDLLTGRAISPIKVETQVVPTPRLVVELAAPHPTRLKRKEGACWLWLLLWGGWIWKAPGLPSETQWLPQSGEWTFRTPEWWQSSQDPLKGGRWFAARMPP